MDEAVDAFAEDLDYPMYIVTVGRDQQSPPESRSGCLVGFATQCSIDPPRFLVCISKANHTYRLARSASILGLHVLGPEQHDLAQLFGGETGDDVDKFAGCQWRHGPGGVPLLTQCPRWLVGNVLHRTDLGDHAGFLLEPTQIHTGPGPAGLYFSQLQDMQAGHPA
ncbi:flavin reductase family protein [Paenarthrobacter sp. PH39-S1]|uniref:flavin reductase family protein n=1 Tax=Paenarthrobacter sp. PH39-S1 TaxID=3046204 RepID=UPI0024B88C52|nr:flavin reductase family protein [Paenarthrobacter sp. PH39-S1]MDJ0356206.1 flavin reductase family protein [Paenarthrobacter sp. PH39-S1]